VSDLAVVALFTGWSLFMVWMGWVIRGERLPPEPRK